MFPEGRERMRAIGYYTAVSIGGSAVGLVAGGILIQFASWRWVMFVNAPIGLAVIVIGLISLPKSKRAAGHFDLAGAATSTIGMTALVYGLIEAGTSGWTNATTIGALIGGAALLGVFVLIERRAISPITPLRLFNDRNHVVSYIARLLLAAVMYGLFFFLAQFMQEILGYSPLAAGLAFLPLTVCLFVSSQTGARLTTRVSRRTLVVVGVTTSALGVFWIGHLSVGSGYLAIAGPLVLIGLGNGLAFVALTALALSNVEPRDGGAAAGLVNVTQQIGAALGLALLVTIFNTASHSSASGPQAFVDGTNRAYLVAAGLLAAVVVISAVVLRTRPESSGTDDLDLEAEILELEMEGSETGL
jgi:MFS family permease